MGFDPICKKKKTFSINLYKHVTEIKGSINLLAKFQKQIA